MLVTGANGAGKSSLLAVLRGRLRPFAGTVTLAGAAGQSVAGPDRAGTIGFVGHQDGLKVALTAHENLAFARDVLGGGGLTPGEALEKLDVAPLAHLPVAWLSAGQRRRVALSRLFVAPRPVWLLDEPAAALDAESTARLGELLRGHLAGGGIVIAATHQPLGLDGAPEVRLEPPLATDDDGDVW